MYESKAKQYVKDAEAELKRIGKGNMLPVTLATLVMLALVMAVLDVAQAIRESPERQ